MDAEALVRDYLAHLEVDAEASRLPADRRGELVGEVREHIELALGEAGRRDEATVRTVLDRLGPVQAIVAAELGSEPLVADATGGAGGLQASVAEPAQGAKGWGPVEVLAVLLVTIGAVLPIVGPLLGLVLTWMSTRWPRRTKLIVTVVGIVMLSLPILGLAVLTTAGGGGGPTLVNPPSVVGVPVP